MHPSLLKVLLDLRLVELLSRHKIMHVRAAESGVQQKLSHLVIKSSQRFRVRRETFKLDFRTHILVADELGNSRLGALSRTPLPDYFDRDVRLVYVLYKSQPGLLDETFRSGSLCGPGGSPLCAGPVRAEGVGVGVEAEELKEGRWLFV